MIEEKGQGKGNRDLFEPDPEQRSVIDFIGGDALVLAPPGCGKTDVLAHRIVKAHRDYDIPYSTMLCLTFTNRASREMFDRVSMHLGSAPRNLFIGNLHRFCIRFLSENNLISLDTSVIDEEDQLEILSEIGCCAKKMIASQMNSIIKIANYKMRISLGFPRELAGKLDKYLNMKRDKEFAERYIEYKIRHHLIDYDDILTLTYSAALQPGFKSLRMSNYSWVQVDEVQDLNPLQLAIVEKLIDREAHTAVFLGDERQAIFSFIGASLDNLDRLKERMKVFTFSTNYRSPKYLLDFINSYAAANFNIEASDLPSAGSNIRDENGLVMFMTKDPSGREEEMLIAAQSRQLAWFNPNETIGILARTNYNLDSIAGELDRHKLKYLKLGKKDLFKTVDFKTLYSHFAVVQNEFRDAEWVRLIYQTGCVERIGDARQYVKNLRQAAISPTDLLRDDESTYTIDFCRRAGEETFVIFDTETTGLDIYNDDIIQIAAVKANAFGIIPGSEFEVVIETDKEIPEKFGETFINPMKMVYEISTRKDFAEAIAEFTEYVGDATLVGHNVNFDIEMLRNNIRRRIGTDPALTDFISVSFDTLKLATLADPGLRSHSLEFLIEYYGIEGTNSHNAVDDVTATANLMLKLYGRLCNIMPMQMELINSMGVRRLGMRLRGRYKSYYEHTLAKLYSPEICEENTLLAELQWVYENFILDKYILPIRNFEYVCELFRRVMIKPEGEDHFGEQLRNHVYDMRTFNEGDFYSNGIVKENIHLMTIHKAKGLQFDNVFVYGVETYPNSMDRDMDSIDESCRVLYVAISRAKRRLYLCCNRYCSDFIDEGMRRMFKIPAPEQLTRIMQLENAFIEGN